MKLRPVYTVLGVALLAAVVALGFSALQVQAHSSPSTHHAHVARTTQVQTSCASVGAWCADAQQVAIHPFHRSANSATPYVQTSCDSVGAWCSDAQRAALQRIQGHDRVPAADVKCGPLARQC